MDYMLGEIQLFPYNFQPVGWTRCDGRSMNVQGNEALYSLIGVTYGGDGRTYFNLPNLTNANPIPYLPSGAPNNNLAYYICTSGLYPQRP